MHVSLLLAASVLGQCPGGYCPGGYAPQPQFGGGYPAVSSVQGYGYSGYSFGGGGFPPVQYSYGGYAQPAPFGLGSCSGGGYAPSFQLQASPGSLFVRGSGFGNYGGGYGYPSGYGYGGPPTSTYAGGYGSPAPR